MKILMVNKFYYIKGGSETYYFSLKKLLEEEGHEVIDFSMQDDKNFNSPYKKYFVKNIEYNKKIGIIRKMLMGINIIYSIEAKRKIRRLIIETKPDIVHLHIFQHQISPSILGVIKKYKIPMVYTAHDLKMLCLNYKMMHHGTICEECYNHRYFSCLKHKCIKDSFFKSAICMIEGYLHTILRSYDKIDQVITPSQFYRDLFIKFKVKESKVRYLPNFLEDCIDVSNPEQKIGTYYLYSGRLSEEKGIVTLLKAFQSFSAVLYIAGAGPLETEIRKYINDNNMKNVIMLGLQSHDSILEYVKGARAVILPSEWYENSPYSGIEALALGRIIVGADIGGIPELINSGINGFLYEAKNVKKLKECLDYIENSSEETLKIMQMESIKLFRERFSKERHKKELLKIYNEQLR